MASETFHTLYAKAFSKDCATIKLIRNLPDSFGALPMVNRAGVADAIQELSVLFIDSMDALARRYNPQKSQFITVKCPICGGRYCQDSLLIEVKPLSSGK